MTATTSLSADAGICPFCVNLVSVSASVNVTAKQRTDLAWAPKATYGDMVWYSTSKTLTAADKPVFVAGTAGTVGNLFGDPAGTLTLIDGETIYMNMLPTVHLTMPITTSATISVPAALSFDASIFGIHSSKTFPLGDLFDLTTGAETVELGGDWFGKKAFSVELDVTKTCKPGTSICSNSFHTPGTAPLQLADNNFLFDLLPPQDQNARNFPVDFTGPGTDFANLRPLFPNGLCSPTDASQCITSINVSVAVPEPASISLLGASLLGFLGLVRRRR